MSDQDADTTKLESFFAAARATAPQPEDDLVARVLADAEAAQPRNTHPVAKQSRARWLPALGGWPALASLVTATVAGVSLGFADPVAVGDLAFGAFGGGYDFSGVGETFGVGLEDG